MNERGITNKLRAIMSIAEKNLGNLNKGSKLLLKISSIVFFIMMLATLMLSILFISNILRFEEQIHTIKWMVLYSFRFWVMLVFGAFILDILTKKQS